MRIVVQRVKQSQVLVGSRVIGQIQQGVLILLGIAKADTTQQADYLIDKLIGLRIFDDGQGKMNLSLQDIQGSVLVVSQFTLLGSCDKGRRPSFDAAASGDLAISLYEYFINQLRQKGLNVQTGQFGAMMEVTIINDGPVTFILEK
jgi:D-tyrosyl-tRNA(Tyr) deacylase